MLHLLIVLLKHSRYLVNVFVVPGKMSDYGVCFGLRGSSRKPAVIIEGLFWDLKPKRLPPILTWGFTVFPYIARIFPSSTTLCSGLLMVLKLLRTLPTRQKNFF